MRNILKSAIVGSVTLAIVLTAGISAQAEIKNTKNNTGNSVDYDGELDMSLGGYYSSDIGVSSCHNVYYNRYDNNKVTVIPYYNKYSYNRCIYYAKYEKSGKIKDSISKTYMLANNKQKDRDLSTGMKLSTWDSDITYFRFDVYPAVKNLASSYIEEGKRRASTDITHS